jgi:ABC-type multidrug transport system fused ATPase/permease subunit
MANAHDFISSFERGYDTVCGERGVALSGGQKQRIAIARAIIGRPALLLCDEATAALDNESERAVQRALDAFLSDSGGSTTTIVVAHRLRTVRNCDYIAVLGEGAVQEFGKHEDLVGIENGLYARMLASG